MIRDARSAYIRADQKSAAAPERRLTGGLEGAFFLLLSFSRKLLARPNARACADFVDVGLVADVAVYRHDRHLHTG